MNKLNDELVCQLYQNNRIYLEKIFSDCKILFSFPFFENKTIEEIWNYSTITVKFIDHTGGMVLIPDYSTRVNNYTYKYDLEKISSLSDLPYLEAQAQLVGDFAEFYYDERYSNGVKYSWNKQDMKKMAEIMKNSGYNTEAVNWVLENY